MTIAPDCRALPNRDQFWIGVYAAQGEAPQRIADMLGIDLVDVLATLAGYAPPVLPADHDWHTVLLAAKDRTRIAAEAQRRGLEMPAIASDVLRIVARDQLFDAVLL